MFLIIVVAKIWDALQVDFVIMSHALPYIFGVNMFQFLVVSLLCLLTTIHKWMGKLNVCNILSSWYCIVL